MCNNVHIGCGTCALRLDQSIFGTAYYVFFRIGCVFILDRYSLLLSGTRDATWRWNKVFVGIILTVVMETKQLKLEEEHEIKLETFK